MQYMGGKGRIVKDILPIILKNRKSSTTYIEPFAGGMNVICEVNGNRIANDINFYLIEMWKALVNGWTPKYIYRDFYYEIKNNPEKFPPYLVGWAGFISSYRGKFFGGYTREGCHPKTGRNYQLEATKNILNQVKKMNGVIFSNQPYYDMIFSPNSIIYCDPPYFGTTNYKDKIDHNFFWEWIRKISLKHEVFISEYTAPNDFECLWQKPIKTTLSSGTGGVSKIGLEKLFKLKT